MDDNSVMTPNLSLENERKERAPLGDVDLADLVNNLAVQRLISGESLGLKEKGVDICLTQLRPFGNNSTDPFLVAFYRTNSICGRVACGCVIFSFYGLPA